MRSMVERLKERDCPSTALHAVPLPMSFAHREETGGRAHFPTIGRSRPCSRAQSIAIP